MSALSPQQDNAELRSDVRRLGELLGQSLARQDGEALLNLVELVRKSVREGSGEDLLNSISTADSVKLVRAFNVYFNLANVAEQGANGTAQKSAPRHNIQKSSWQLKHCQKNKLSKVGSPAQQDNQTMKGINGNLA